MEAELQPPVDYRTRATASATARQGTTESRRVEATGGYPGEAQDHLRARRAAPTSARMEAGSAAPTASAVARGSAGALTEAQSARRRNHTKSIGHYILGKTIGEGTFGKVKLGTHILTGEKVAVKVLEKERIIDVADVERVAREVYILKLIRHSHVVQLYEIIETSRQLYLIMEYASGGELFDYIVASGRIQEAEACRFFRQIIDGVEEIHKMNVVHRDLKPENLLLDEHCDIKIVDFGLSNTYREGQLLKTACGSPCYAAPEMIAGKEYVPSLCDIWSCGVILFAMLCGYLPFEDQNTAALYRKILAAEYTLPDFLSASARELISGMLTTDPTRRLTAAALRQQPWFTSLRADSPVREDGALARDGHFEEDILEELEKFGFPPDYTQRCLRLNKHNHVTTTYHLLERKKQRMMDQVMLDQMPQEGFNGSNGHTEASNACQGASVRVGGYDGEGSVQGEDYNHGNNSARGAAPMDGSSSARGGSSVPRSNYAGSAAHTRPSGSPARASTPGASATAPAPAWQAQQLASQVRDMRDPRTQGGYAPNQEAVGGPPSPRNSARGTGTTAVGQPVQPRWATRTTVPPQPGSIASPGAGPTAYRAESPAGAAAAAAALQGNSVAGPSRRSPREITTPRGVRRPSQDRLPGKSSATESYERDRDRSERDRSAMEERGPGTPGASASYPAGPQAGEQPRSARTSFGATATRTDSGVTASASGSSRTAATGNGSPGTSAGGNRSGRLPSPPRVSNRNAALPGQPPTARPLTTPSHLTSAPNSARGSFPPSSRGGSHSLSTRAAYSMSARSQTPPATQPTDSASRNQTPSRSSNPSSARGPSSKPAPMQSPPEREQQPMQPQQTQPPQPRTPLMPGAAAMPSASAPSTQPVASAGSQQVPNSTPPQHPTAYRESSQPPLQQPTPGTPPQLYQPQMPGQQMTGQAPGTATAPPGSTAAALAALRLRAGRSPYSTGEVTPRSEANTPRGSAPAPGAPGVAGSSGSNSARGPAPQLGQPGAQHGLPRWPGSGTGDPARAPGIADRPLTAERPQERQVSQDRPLSSRAAPTTDLDASMPSTFAPLSARGSTDASAAPLSSREAREDRRAALDTLRTSSRPPRLIMQELQRVLAAQRVASKQISPLTLRCQWLNLKFDVEVAPLDRLGSIHAVRARRTAGEPWQYKDVCNRLLAELRIA